MQAQILFEQSSKISTDAYYIPHVASSSYNDQSNGQGEISTRFVIWTMKKCFKTNTEIYVAFAGKPQFAKSGCTTVQQTCKRLTAKVHHAIHIIDNDESNHTALIKGQSHLDVQVLRKTFLPTGLPVAVQCEDGRPWTHGTVVWHGSDDHHDRNYKIQVPKMGHIITRTNWHVKTTLITEEEYLRNKVVKMDKMQGSNQFNELKDHYTKLYENEALHHHVWPCNEHPIHMEPWPVLFIRREKGTLQKWAIVKITENTLTHITCRHQHEKQDQKG